MGRNFPTGRNGSVPIIKAVLNAGTESEIDTAFTTVVKHSDSARSVVHVARLDRGHRQFWMISIAIAGARGMSRSRFRLHRLVDSQQNLGALTVDPMRLSARGNRSILRIERFLDPATREVLQAWIEKDVFMWRVKAMLAHPPNWRLSMLDGLLRLQLLQPQLSGYEHPAPSPTRAAPELEHGV
jgi:hypothetical protein